MDVFYIFKEVLEIMGNQLITRKKVGLVKEKLKVISHIYLSTLQLF